jgi:NAD(P)-dependent dehydrogenase (short-subunit alcohol dehydrogenase family)
MSGRLQGKVAIVTGAASGIGKASAALFAAEGATVLAADVESGEGIIGADAGREEDVIGLVELAKREHGGLDIFFANAGISGGLASLFEQSPEDWQEILRINLIGPWLAAKHAAPVMKERGGGSIIATASVAGIRACAGGPAYSASKAGVINFVTVAATQLCGANIRVNAICPGLIETGMTKGIFDGARSSGREAMLGQLNPLKRYGVPEEIAKAALFLASDDASYVTGAELAVDGGMGAML